MANPTIGFIDCPFGGGKSEVRKDKKDKLYYYNENIGMVKPNLSGGQAYMKKHAKFVGANGELLPPLNSVNEKSSDDNSVNENEKSWLSSFLND